MFALKVFLPWNEAGTQPPLPCLPAPCACPCASLPPPAGPHHPSLASFLRASSIPQSTIPQGPTQCQLSQVSLFHPLPSACCLKTGVAGVMWNHIGVALNQAVSSGWEPLCCLGPCTVSTRVSSCLFFLFCLSPSLFLVPSLQHAPPPSHLSLSLSSLGTLTPTVAD